MGDVLPFVLKDRHSIVNALTRDLQSSFTEVLAEPIPEAWLALLRRLDGEDLGERH
jgi:Anti-sigma factor NepR